MGGWVNKWMDGWVDGKDLASYEQRERDAWMVA